MRKSLFHLSALLLIAFSAAAPKPKPTDHWVATWAASPSPANPDIAQMRRRKLEFNEQTLRQIVHLSLGGSQFRVRLSNAFGTQAVTIGAAHLALRAAGANIAPQSDRELRFSGRPAIAIPPGAMALSDPVALQAPAAADLAVSFYLPAGPTAATTVHYSAQQTSYVSAGNVCAAAQLPEPATISSWAYLNGVDVMAGQAAAAVVTLGDSITDGARSTADANGRWPDWLARRLLKRPGNQLAVINAGIGGNRILHDFARAPDYGVSALARFDRDVLAQPGVKYVIVLEGVNDLGHPGGTAPMSEDVTDEDVIAGLRQLVERAHEHGLKIFGGTIMPFRTTPEREAKRQAINQWIRDGRAFDGVIDFDKVIRDPQAPTNFLPAYDSGDHLHPNDTGHQAMGEAIDLSLFRVD